jgi:hypothetical protein
VARVLILHLSETLVDLDGVGAIHVPAERCGGAGLDLSGVRREAVDGERLRLSDRIDDATPDEGDNAGNRNNRDTGPGVEKVLGHSEPH